MLKSAVLLVAVTLLVTSGLTVLSIKADAQTITVPDADVSPTPTPTENATQTKQPVNPDPTELQGQSENPQPLPSSFLIATAIIALVALFGAAFSLSLQYKRGREARNHMAARLFPALP
jgi:hypothetical protein